MSEAMERPTSVEVGQRWREDDPKATPYMVVAVDPTKGAKIIFDDGQEHDYWHRQASILADIYLGHGPPRSQVAAHDQTTCMYCAGGIACPEFGRMFAAGKVSVIAPAAAPPPRYNLAAGAELRYSNGHPRTALEAIQARRKPEPWRPSVDDFDLLPDVDVRR